MREVLNARPRGGGPRTERSQGAMHVMHEGIGGGGDGAAGRQVLAPALKSPQPEVHRLVPNNNTNTITNTAHRPMACERTLKLKHLQMYIIENSYSICGRAGPCFAPPPFTTRPPAGPQLCYRTRHGFALALKRRFFPANPLGKP